MREIPLAGGGLVDRGLVRIGDTVRRPWGEWTPSVHLVLNHLRHKGFTQAPPALGRDELGREIVGFIPGEDSGWPAFRPALLEIDGARKLGRLVRDLQNALSTFACPQDAVWQFCAGPPAPGQAMQHGDLGPWNLVWNGDEVAGIIDWDFTHPGDPGYDIGHLAWFTVPFLDDERARERGFPEPPDRRARLAAFAAGCGSTPAEVRAAAIAAQRTYADRIRALDFPPWTHFRSVGLHENADRDRAWTEAWSL
jgi:Ser/Thr protein kinase RdoA (MazF antagonist)